MKPRKPKSESKPTPKIRPKPKAKGKHSEKGGKGGKKGHIRSLEETGTTDDPAGDDLECLAEDFLDSIEINVFEPEEPGNTNAIPDVPCRNIEN